MKILYRKTKIGSLLLVIFLILAVQFFALSKHRKKTTDYNRNQQVLSVSDAKEFALKNNRSEEIVNVKGIYSGSSEKNSKGIVLEDIEPTGLEDMLLYCSFRNNELSSYKLKQGAEITVSGKLNRKLNYIEVTDCKLICINEAVLLYDFTTAE